MLAALVLDILGVEPDVIVADYVITAGRMELILDRYRSDPDLRGADGQGPASDASAWRPTPWSASSRPPPAVRRGPGVGHASGRGRRALARLDGLLLSPPTSAPDRTLGRQVIPGELPPRRAGLHW